MHQFVRHAATVLLLTLSVPLSAFDLTFEAQANHYPELEPANRGSLALTASANAYSREDGQNHNLDLQIFARAAEGADARRQHFDLRELSYLWAQDAVEVRFGFGRVFWGVTESAHLVDIVNQDDALEDIDGEDKLGQPLLGLSYRIGQGRVGGLVMPRFRPRRFGPVFHELAPVPIDEDAAQYESSRGKQHVDYAWRLTQRFGPLDLGLSYFNGTGREPTLLPCARQGSGRPGTEQGPNCDLDAAFAPPTVDPLSAAVIDLAALLGLSPSRDELEQAFIDEAIADVDLVPFYPQIEQWGLSAQYIWGPAAWKLEARSREQADERHLAFVAGVEYSLGVFFSGLLDVGLLAEYLYDDRDPERFLNLFQDDIFVGARLLGNDVAGTQALGGVIVDRADGSVFASLEASRRFGGSLRGALEVRWFEPGDEAGVLEFLDGLDSVRLQFEYFL